MTTICKKYREQDEYVCARCGYRWDVSDPEPPKCLSKQEFSQKQIQKLRDSLK